MIKIGLGQMNTQDKKQDNLASAEKLINELAGEGARLIMLPEYFNFLGPDELKAENAEPIDDSRSLEMIRKKAKELKVYIHIGSYLERDGDKIYNTGVVFDPAGELLAKYRKIHLFDVEIPGGVAYLESATITAGDSTTTFSIDDLKFGMSTCYDLRFPEMFRRLSAQGAQVILLPAAFTLQTGRDHWELLLRARAVENLCWVAAAGQWGPSPPDHICFGRSMIINPWGIVIAQAPDGVSTVAAEINLEILEKTRKTFPALNHRRQDLFPL
jgi:predicted amidohydrolase